MTLSGISRDDMNNRASWVNRMHVGESAQVWHTGPNVILLAESVMLYESDTFVQLVEIQSYGVSKYEVHELRTSAHMTDDGQRVITHENVKQYPDLDTARKGFVMRAYGLIAR